MVFGRSKSKAEEHPALTKDELVDRLLNADELGRRQLLLEALQAGYLKKSEAGDLIRLVERLESVSHKS